MLLVAGCTAKPCATSTECGSGEVCAGERCQALSCEETFAAIDPADGKCKPIGACAADDTVRGWTSCADPCVGLGEFACVKDNRCQPAYNALGSNAKAFAGCRANPIDVIPCAKLDEKACGADSRCVVEHFATGGGCDCAADSVCNCGDVDTPAFECREKGCSDYTQFECLGHPECTTSPTPVPFCNCPPNADCACAGDVPAGGPGTGGGGIGIGSTGGSCFPRFFGCSGMDEATCLQHPECHPVGNGCFCPPGASCACSGGPYLYCEPDDGLPRCNTDNDCSADQRCSNDEQCAPTNGSTIGQPGFGVAGSGSTGVSPSGTTGTKSLPDDPAVACAGLCVPKGCAGFGETRCNADPTCEAVYMLQCSPYGGGLGGGLDPICGDTGGGPNSGAPISCGGGCEPSFVQCKEGGDVHGVAPGKSVLVREPGVVDDPLFAFSNVMTALAGGQDPNAFVTRWLQQMTVDQTANGRVAAARPGTGEYLANLPHLSNGYLDVKNLGFQTTSLSNRLDLAGPHDCGEARITFALAGGVTDRRHRMTVIVELRQPDDGAFCSTVAQQWLALSSLSGQELTNALKLIYAPLLAPATLNQVRTNEFLVGPGNGAPPAGNPSQAWELREWRLGSDGALHLAPSKQAVDPQVVNDFAFQDWVRANQPAVLTGLATLPDAYLAVTSSEDGQRMFLPTDTDGSLSAALNKVACAGCHTTESNTAFVHVAERFHGTGAATISKFLEDQLSSRALHVWGVAHGRLTATLRAAPHPVH